MRGVPPKHAHAAHANETGWAWGLSGLTKGAAKGMQSVQGH